MSEIVERLHIIRNHLRTGALGQREVWEEWLTEAADEIKRLQAALEQAVDDFGEGHCVCEQTKQECIAALERKL